jgi:transcriptional regulator with XRE-family HTH domain
VFLKEDFVPKHRPDDNENMLKHFRSLLGLTQEEAASKIGVSRTLWSAWESRNRPMTIAQLNAMQRALSLADEDIEDIRRWWGEHCLVVADEVVP